jgi:hypothetical protein
MDVRVRLPDDLHMKILNSDYDGKSPLLVTAKPNPQNALASTSRGKMRKTALVALFAAMAVCLVAPTFGGTILPPDAFWGVTDVSNPNAPNNLGTLQAPFGAIAYATGFPTTIPQVITPWDTNGLDATWLLQTKVNLPTNVNLSAVNWAIAIDNYYELTVNGIVIKIFNGGLASAYSLTAFTNGVLHYGENDIDVLIAGNDGFWGGTQ